MSVVCTSQRRHVAAHHQSPCLSSKWLCSQCSGSVRLHWWDKQWALSPGLFCPQCNSEASQMRRGNKEEFPEISWMKISANFCCLFGCVILFSIIRIKDINICSVRGYIFKTSKTLTKTRFYVWYTCLHVAIGNTCWLGCISKT